MVIIQQGVDTLSSGKKSENNKISKSKISNKRKATIMQLRKLPGEKKN